MKITKGRLYYLVALLVPAAFTLSACGSVIGAAARTGGKAVERAIGGKGQETTGYLTFRGSFQEVNKVILETILAQGNLRITTRYATGDSATIEARITDPRVTDASVVINSGILNPGYVIVMIHSLEESTSPTSSDRLDQVVNLLKARIMSALEARGITLAKG